VVWVPCSQCVHIRFPKAPQVVPQEVPNSTSYLSHMVCPKFFTCSINWKGRLCGGAYLFLFWDWGSKRDVSIGGSAQCSKKNWWWANQCDSFKKTEKEEVILIKSINWLLIVHELINMDHTMSHSLSDLSSTYACNIGKMLNGPRDFDTTYTKVPVLCGYFNS